MRPLVFFAFSLFCFSWLVPFHYIPWRSAHQEFLAFAAVGFLLLASANRSFKVPAPVIYFSVISIIPLFQYVLGTISFLGDAVVAFLYVAVFFLAMLTGYNLSSDSRYKFFFVNGFMLLFVLGAVLSVFISVQQWLLQSDGKWVLYMATGNRPYGNIGQPNNLATLLGMGLASVLYLFERKLISHVFASFIGIFILFGLALTQSRAGGLSMLLLCLLWVFKISSCRFSSRIGARSCWALGFLFSIFFFVIPFISEALNLSLVGISDRLDSSGRIDLYFQFIELALNGPLFGYGWNQVSVAQVLGTLDMPVALMTNYTHNLFLDFLIWNGLLGVLINAVIVFWFVRLLIYIDSSQSLCFFSVVSFFLIHSMFEYPYAYAYILFPVAVCLGVLEVQISRVKVFHVSWFLLCPVVFIVTVMCFQVFRDYRVVEEDYRDIQLENARILGSKRLDGCGADVYILNNLKYFACFARADIQDSFSSAELKEIKSVVYRYPYAPSLYRYALILSSHGKDGEAYEHFMILRGLYGQDVFLKYLADLRSRKTCFYSECLLLRLDHVAQ